MKLRHAISALLIAGGALVAGQAAAAPIIFYTGTIGSWAGDSPVDDSTLPGGDPSGGGADAKFTLTDNGGLSNATIVTISEDDLGGGFEQYEVIIHSDTGVVIPTPSSFQYDIELLGTNHRFDAGKLSPSTAFTADPNQYAFNAYVNSNTLGGSPELLHLTGNGSGGTQGLFHDTSIHVRNTISFSGPGANVNAVSNSFVVEHYTPSLPEPVSLSLFGIGLAAMGVIRRRRSA